MRALTLVDMRQSIWGGFGNNVVSRLLGLISSCRCRCGVLNRRLFFNLDRWMDGVCPWASLVSGWTDRRRCNACGMYQWSPIPLHISSWRAQFCKTPPASRVRRLMPGKYSLQSRNKSISSSSQNQKMQQPAGLRGNYLSHAKTIAYWSNANNATYVLDHIIYFAAKVPLAAF